MKYLITTLIFSQFLFGSLKAQKISSEAKEYFFEIAFGTEFSIGNALIKKWAGPIKIAVLGQKLPYMEKELDKVILEINELIKVTEDLSEKEEVVDFTNIGSHIMKIVTQSVFIERVNQSKDANFIVFLGSDDDYVAQIQKNAKELVKTNRGLFYVYYNAKNEIYRGSMYVDTDFLQDENAEKHILREEITQALGLMNDSYDYEESMFYQGWTTTTSYTEIDKELIKILYSPKIKSYMTTEEVKKILKQL